VCGLAQDVNKADESSFPLCAAVKWIVHQRWPSWHQCCWRVSWVWITVYRKTNFRGGCFPRDIS